MAAFAGGVLLPAAYAAEGHYAIDPAHTVVTFDVQSLGISSERGTFNRAVGTVSLDADAGTGSIDIVVDARSITADSGLVESFMRGDALLNVKQFPAIEYRADHMEFADGAPRRIVGDLTLLGVTRAVPLSVTRYGCVEASDPARKRCIVHATASFKRSEFGMTRYLAIGGDDVQLGIEAEVERGADHRDAF